MIRDVPQRLHETVNELDTASFNLGYISSKISEDIEVTEY